MNTDRNLIATVILVGILINVLCGLYCTTPKQRKVIVLPTIHITGYSPHMELAKLVKIDDMVAPPKARKVEDRTPLATTTTLLQASIQNNPLADFLRVPKISMRQPEPMVLSFPTNNVIKIDLYDPETKVVFNDTEVPVVQIKEGV